MDEAAGSAPNAGQERKLDGLPRIERPPLDLTLLNGFRFGCRPDCSLCCYSTPSVTIDEKSALLQIEPSTSFLLGESEGYGNVASRPNGGACFFLRDKRCRAYPARPFPCTEYPVTVHIGTRIQATVVLACPGIPLEGLIDWAGSSPPDQRPEGFDSELGRVTAEIYRQPVGEWITEALRLEQELKFRLAKRSQWQEPAGLKETIGSDLPWPSDEDFPPTDPPEIGEGWDSLPFYFEEGRGPVTFLSRKEGWEAFGMLEAGNPRRSLGIIPRIDHMPKLEEGATLLLRGYLTYTLQRDFLFWLAYRELDSHKDVSLEEMVRSLLLELGVQAVARGAFRTALSGNPWETLRMRDIVQGIRAVDADFMDQPTLGGVL